MRKRLYILVASGLAAAAVLLLLRPGEPSYQGRSLSDWIVMLHKGKAPEREEARVVVHRLGTNSVPLLLKWLQQPDRPSLKARLSRARDGAIAWLEGHKLLTSRPHRVEMDWKDSYRSLAIEAFTELGPDGKEAIPTLIQLLGARAGSTNEPSDTAGFAYVVLRKMSPAAIPALLDALTSQDRQVWILSTAALADIGPEAKAAIPALRSKLKDPDPMIRVEAADAIGRLGGDPDEFMPIVVETLRDRDFDNLEGKLEVLLRYKDHARSAVPVLRELLASIPDFSNSTNWTIHFMLTNALGQLSTDASPGQQVK